MLWLFRLGSFLYYLGFVIGFFWTRPPVFATFTFAFKVILAVFLLYRFKTEKKITRLDREIVLFSAGFILVSSFTDYINQFLEKLRAFLWFPVSQDGQRSVYA